MKITIDNRTHWNGRHLRAFASRAVAAVMPAGAKQGLKIRFYHGRRDDGMCSGHAYLGGSFLAVGIPGEAPDKVDLAHTIAHEIGHCLGLQHRDMRGSAFYSRTGPWRDLYAWAATLPLEEKKKERKPSRLTRLELAERRLDDANARLAKIEAKIKRLQASRLHLIKRAGYYARRAWMLRPSGPPRLPA